MKRLYLSNVSDDFDANNDILLGPWCFLGLEEQYPGWELLEFPPDPFFSTQILSRFANITVQYANETIPILANRLNYENKSTYSEIFWKILLLPWLLTLIQVVYDHQCRVEWLIRQYADKEVSVVLVKDDVQWLFKDTEDFITNGPLNWVFNDWLYSRLIEKMKPEKWKVSYSAEPKLENQNHHDTPKNIKDFAKWFLRQFAPRCYGVYGIGPLASIVWSAFLSIKPRFRDTLDYNKQDIYGSTKIESEHIIWSVDFENLIEQTMPTCFKEISTLNNGFVRPKFDKIRIVGPVTWYQEREKFQLANAIDKGEKIFITQHGGLYGTAKVFSLVGATEYNYSHFISWGWTKQEEYTGNIVALPSPYLSRFANKHKQQNNNLIVVGTRANLYLYRFDSMPQALQQLSYRQSKNEFFSNLNSKIFSNTFYRPYSNDGASLIDRPYYETRFPGLKMCEGDLHSQILKCKLLVLDHPVTTLNISMAANIPMIGFWDKKAWAMCRQAIPFFDELEQVGIIFETGEEAAKKVNEIWGNVQEWWNQPEIQSARKSWCYQYARTSKTWWLDWIKFLWRI